MTDLQLKQFSQGSPSIGFWQFRDFARILAVEVFPTPLGPENKYA